MTSGLTSGVGYDRRPAGLGLRDLVRRTRLQHRPEAGAAVDRRLGGRHEVGDDLDEPVRVLLVREVSRVAHHLGAQFGRQRKRVVQVCRRDDCVVGSPDEEHRHRAGEVGAVRHGHDLAAPVDDGADDVADGGPGSRVAERLDDVGHLVQVAGVREPRARHQAHRRGGQVPESGEGQHAHELVEAGRRDRPDRGRHVRAQPSRRHEDHPVGALGELVGELHRDPASEAVPDHRDLVDAEHCQQVAHAVGVAADAVVGARLVRPPVPEQVGGDHGVVLGQSLDDRRPGGVVGSEAVQQEEDRTAAGLHEGASMPVERDERHVVRRGHDHLLRGERQTEIANSTRPRFRDVPGRTGVRVPVWEQI